MSRYIALIHRGETGSWGISFPDFPGCISAADRGSFPDIVDRGAAALRFHVEGLRDAGLAIPEPRPIEALRADPEFADDFADAIVTLVPLLPPRAKPLRINISIDSNLLLEIDAKAEQLGMNRSEFLAEAARRCILGDAKIVRHGNRYEAAGGTSTGGSYDVGDAVVKGGHFAETRGGDPMPPRNVPEGRHAGRGVRRGITKGMRKR
jgi:predicted RNase H-like HicB family nuclease